MKFAEGVTDWIPFNDVFDEDDGDKILDSKDTISELCNGAESAQIVMH